MMRPYLAAGNGSPSTASQRSCSGWPPSCGPSQPVGPRRAVGRVRVRRRRHRAVGRDRRPVAPPPGLGRLLGRHRHRRRGRHLRVAVHHRGGAADRDRDLVAAHRRLPDRVAVTDARRCGARGRSRSAAPCSAARRALVIDPGAGALGITWAIGWFAFLFGIVQLWLASLVRRETHELTTPTRIQTSQSGHPVG